MAIIHIKRKHGRTGAEARALADKIAADLESEFDLEHWWQDDVLLFRRAGAAGRIAIADETVDVKIRLGLMLAPIKRKIEQAISESLDEIEADGGSAQSTLDSAS